MTKINTHDAKTRLSALLAAVEERGESFLICRNGKPVAALVRPPAPEVPDPLQVHPELQGRILYDPTEHQSFKTIADLAACVFFHVGGIQPVSQEPRDTHRGTS